MGIRAGGGGGEGGGVGGEDGDDGDADQALLELQNVRYTREPSLAHLSTLEKEKRLASDVAECHVWHSWLLPLLQPRLRTRNPSAPNVGSNREGAGSQALSLLSDSFFWSTKAHTQ